MVFNKYLLGLIIIIVIGFIYIISKCNTSKYERYVYGFWVSDDTFCEESDVESILIFIGEPNKQASFGGSVQRNAYIVIQDSEGILCSQGFTLKYRPGWGGPSISNYIIEPTLEFESDDVFPERVTMSFDPLRGILRIYAGGTMFFCGYRENSVSSALQ